MLGALLIALSFAVTVHAQPADTSARYFDPELATLQQKLPVENLTANLINDRIEAASYSLLNRPYLLGPLGEGDTGLYDQDPIYRTDVFDCTTFVETVIALAETTTVETFKTTLQKIRYSNAQINFVQRNHFVEIDWNKNNQRLGLLEDVTNKVALSTSVLSVPQLFDKRAWYQNRSSGDLRVYSPLSAEELGTRVLQLRGEGQNFEPQKNDLTVVQPGNLQAVLSKMIAPAVLNIVRKFEVAPVGLPNSFVVHQVLLVNKNGQNRIRQASSRTDVMQVIDSSIEDFLASPVMAQPNLVGVNIQKIKKI